MHIPKNYLHDKFILLLLSTTIFLAFLCIILILLRLGVGQGSDSYIVQYRANLGISAFKTGGLAGIIGFGVFAVLSSVVAVLLSVRIYALRRSLAITILGLGLLLLSMAIIVSNSLLMLR